MKIGFTKFRLLLLSSSLLNCSIFAESIDSSQEQLPLHLDESKMATIQRKINTQQLFHQAKKDSKQQKPVKPQPLVVPFVPKPEGADDLKRDKSFYLLERKSIPKIAKNSNTDSPKSPQAQISNSSKDGATIASSKPVELQKGVLDDGSLIFSFKNRSSMGADEVYIQVLGENPTSHSACFIQYHEDGNFDYIDLNQDSQGTNFSYPLSYFLNEKAINAWQIRIPKLVNGKIYVSMHKPIVFAFKDSPTNWISQLPSHLQEADANNKTLWDVIDFTNDKGLFSIGSGDYSGFCLPIGITIKKTNGSSKYQGYSKNRNAIVKDFEKEIIVNESWWRLIDYKKQYIYSPQQATKLGLFSEDYFMQSNWIKSFKDFFSKEDLTIDLGDLFSVESGGGIWKGRSDPMTNILCFKRMIDQKHPKTVPIYLSLPTKFSQLTTGSGNQWQAHTYIHKKMAEFIGFAINTNLLNTKSPLSRKYFLQNQSSFFEENVNMPSDLQFINLYEKGKKSCSFNQSSFNFIDVFSNQTNVDEFAGAVIQLNSLN